MLNEYKIMQKPICGSCLLEQIPKILSVPDVGKYKSIPSPSEVFIPFSTRCSQCVTPRSKCYKRKTHTTKQVKRIFWGSKPTFNISTWMIYLPFGGPKHKLLYWLSHRGCFYLRIPSGW